MNSGVLLTGFPNVTSRALVRALLCSERWAGVPVFLLVAPENEAVVQAFLPQVGPLAQQRVEVVFGRLAAIDFGLGGKEYRSLADRVMCIHHTAPSVAPNADRKRAQEANIASTREVIEFARVATELQCLVFYSSVLVWGSGQGEVFEREVIEGGGYACPAQRALLGAEHMVYAAMQRLPAVILRPSLVSCDSQTGESDRDSPLAQLMTLLLRAPRDLPLFMPGPGHHCMPVVPVDFLVNFALHVARQPQALGQVFHVTDPNPPTLEQVFHCARPASGSGPVRTMPSGLGRALFSAPGPLSWAHTPRLLLDLMTSPVRYDTTHADAVLTDAGLVCAPFSQYAAQFVQGLGRRADLRRSEAPSA